MNKKILPIVLIILCGGLITEACASQDFPNVEVSSINLNEKINTESLDKGVLLDPKDNVPTNDSIVLFGHRTQNGGPFLKLDKVKKGDNIILNWPNLGKFNYTVTNITIMPKETDLDIDNKNSIYLITCDPIGSTENRLIVKGKLTN